TRGQPAEPCRRAGFARLRRRYGAPRRRPLPRPAASGASARGSGGTSAAGLPAAYVLAGLHPPEQPLDHLRGALRRPEIAELDPGHLAGGIDDVEPHYLTGLEIDQRRIIELLGTADIGRAKADDAAGEADEAQGDPPLGGDLVLGVEEQGVIVAALLPQPHRVLPKRPVETAAALRRQVIA